ncbi:hypothetical protein [Amaricoccus sp.]|uniref:hypothetical protein n=1 Tax=Amaricoccus sp. TaxID=1872485 RepID=UPI001B66F6F4|nr:hypothetical protein [Amaricoccus sp.]MBP7243424.1 hypothetical protein [Amaricoccus sp.]
MSRVTMRKRPSPGSATARVWEIADDLLRRRGSLPGGREVADLYVAEGGNEGTAFTQYSHWKKAYQNHFTRGAGASAPREDRALHLNVDAAGRLVLPAEALAGMDLGADGRVTGRLEDGELRLISPRVALRRLRKAARDLAPEGMAVVDEFIAEKRREAEFE